MTQRQEIFRRFSIIGGAAVLLLTQGCGEDWAQNLAIGRPVPNARLHVSLAEPMSNYDLFRRLDETIRAAGFIDRRGQPPVLPDEPLIEGTHRFWSWSPSERSGATGCAHSMEISWDEVQENPTGFDFYYQNDGTAYFKGDDWVSFYHWKDERLPAAFPGATITITRHPAQFTHFDDLIEISEATGISIPDRLIQLHKDWKTTNP